MILTEPSLFSAWNDDIKTMSYRIIEMRKELYKLLQEDLKTPAPAGRGDWGHIKEQIVGPTYFTSSLSQPVDYCLFRAGHVLLHRTEPATKQTPDR